MSIWTVWQLVVMIDWSLNLSTILQIVSFIGTIAWMFLTMRSDLRIMRRDLDYIAKQQGTLNEAFTQLGTVLTQVAVQDNRLHMVEKNIDELRHGQGFVKI